MENKQTERIIEQSKGIGVYAVMLEKSASFYLALSRILKDCLIDVPDFYLANGIIQDIRSERRGYSYHTNKMKQTICYSISPYNVMLFFIGFPDEFVDHLINKYAQMKYRVTPNGTMLKNK